MSYKIVILGAGAVGCHFGPSIAKSVHTAKGHVCQIGREATIAPLQQSPLILNDDA